MTRADLCACLALAAYFLAVVAIAWMGGGG